MLAHLAATYNLKRKNFQPPLALQFPASENIRRPNTDTPGQKHLRKLISISKWTNCLIDKLKSRPPRKTRFLEPFVITAEMKTQITDTQARRTYVYQTISTLTLALNIDLEPRTPSDCFTSLHKAGGFCSQ